MGARLLVGEAVEREVGEDLVRVGVRGRVRARARARVRVRVRARARARAGIRVRARATVRVRVRVRPNLGDLRVELGARYSLDARVHAQRLAAGHERLEGVVLRAVADEAADGGLLGQDGSALLGLGLKLGLKLGLGLGLGLGARARARVRVRV